MWLLHWKGRVLATGLLGKSIVHNSPQPTGWQRVCANSSLWNTHSRGFISLVSYPWCISLLLNHVHPRQLAREKAASPQSRVIHLRETGQHGALSGETSIRLLGSSHPPKLLLCFQEQNYQDRRPLPLSSLPQASPGGSVEERENVLRSLSNFVSNSLQPHGL